ncbi:MAG: transglycosylase SLT domain-containing protein, partial [Deltaproteobacteria bacterium]|nr:transglycosylase SLT domain-containing protein [Deltaproteobacteria bacterium]
ELIAPAAEALENFQWAAIEPVHETPILVPALLKLEERDPEILLPAEFGDEWTAPESEPVPAWLEPGEVRGLTENAPPSRLRPPKHLKTEPLKEVRGDGLPEKGTAPREIAAEIDPAEGKISLEAWDSPPLAAPSPPPPAEGEKKKFSPALAHFPSLLNEKVGDFVEFFQKKADGFFTRALGRSNVYADMMKRILREKNLPEELFYLALIESGYNPHALSRAKAGGIWQFMTKTAQRFGLKVDKWVDERRDPEKSTYAAAAYLKRLYEMFENWDLVAASYNAGEGKVMRAMKKANTGDFWRLSETRFLRPETQEYVPMFLAAVTIAEEPQRYGFGNITYQSPLLFDKVTVPPSTALEVIARAAEVPFSEIRELNPALKRGKTPPRGTFEIRIPLGTKAAFERNFSPLLKAGKARHSVRRGESLSGISAKYRISLASLCKINKLSPRARIKPGKVLLLPLPQ